MEKENIWVYKKEGNILKLIKNDSFHLQMGCLAYTVVLKSEYGDGYADTDEELTVFMKEYDSLANAQEAFKAIQTVVKNYTWSEKDKEQKQIRLETRYAESTER